MENPRPPKKPKLDASATDTALSMAESESQVLGQGGSATVAPNQASSAPSAVHEQLQKELAVGISSFVSPELPGFEGVLKKRYTDFLVNEITPSGKVAHLDELKPPPRGNGSSGATHRGGEAAATSDQSKDTPTIEGAPNPSAIDQASSANGDTKTDPSKTPQDETPPQHEPTSQAQDASHATETTTGAEKWQSFAAKNPGAELGPEHEEALKALLDQEVITQVLALFNRIISSPHRKASSYGTVTAPPEADRDKRTSTHQAIRQIFGGRLDSQTNNDGAIVISASGREPQRPKERGEKKPKKDPRGTQASTRLQFAELGGDYLHFSLYKENKDTMEVLSYLSHKLHVRPQSFQFAGTKDRRGVTVQRVSVYRIPAERMYGAGRTLRGSYIGNFDYQPTQLMLGDLTGNEFVITLRECQFENLSSDKIKELVEPATKLVRTAMQNLVDRGYLNYYGLQRFGTFAQRTDTVGMKLLQGDFKGAADAILDFNTGSLTAEDPHGKRLDRVSADDRARAQAIQHFRSGEPKEALSLLPRKFSAESALIRHLGAPKNANDFLGAFMLIPRNLRSMYLHAYQSIIWNLACSHRWQKHGNSVLEGDLVYEREYKLRKKQVAVEKKEQAKDGSDATEMGGANHDSPSSEDSNFDPFERAIPLTAEDIASGIFDIFDVILPTPGFDILYPSYMLEFYQQTMASPEYGGLDPNNMRRSSRDLSLSGSYRKMLARPGPKWDARVEAYSDENKQFVDTDLDLLRARGEFSKKRTDEVSVPGKGGRAGPKLGDPADKTTADATESTAPKESPVQKEQASAADEATPAQATDVEMGDMKDEPTQPTQPDKLAVILTLQLDKSQYATMALRELMKYGGVRTFKPDYGSGR